MKGYSSVTNIAKKYQNQSLPLWIGVNCISPSAILAATVVKAVAAMDRKTLQEMISSTDNLKEVMLDENDVAEAAL
ncbi:unnamed protein product [Dovyalis caffra]|uniref:Uncharacterized protein n=1 Tax=Dovyalis caffra TaxID=77055 RepID=A0AAV1RZN7_9ROSI|nr:unnamed protein product [Dovyalis caffra]